MRGMQTIRRPAFPLVRRVARGGVEPPTFRFKIDVSGHVWVPLGIACGLRRCRAGRPAGSGHWWSFSGGSWG